MANSGHASRSQDYYVAPTLICRNTKFKNETYLPMLNDEHSMSSYLEWVCWACRHGNLFAFKGDGVDETALNNVDSPTCFHTRIHPQYPPWHSLPHPIIIIPQFRPPSHPYYPHPSIYAPPNCTPRYLASIIRPVFPKWLRIRDFFRKRNSRASRTRFTTCVAHVVTTIPCLGLSIRGVHCILKLLDIK